MTTIAAAAVDTVERLAEAGATGALHSAAGTVYLADGAVVQVESDRATGLADVLTACGRISPDTWHETVRVFGPGRRVGRMLVERGHLTPGELELCHLGALYDAAFFTLSAPPTAASFAPGLRHWLGPVSRVDVRTLLRETARRRSLLDRIWPWPQLDAAPVVRIEGARLRAGPRGRRLLELADGRRTPAEIARLLGRSAFATTADIRRLAAAGLVETPSTETRSTQSFSSRSLLSKSPPAGTAPLPRRRPRPSVTAHPPSVHDPDVALLTRVLTALEARL